MLIDVALLLAALGILGGAEVPADSFRDCVGVKVDGKFWGTTGVLISPDMVLTSGSAYRAQESPLYPTKEGDLGGLVEICIGTNWNKPERVYRVRAVIRHPDYSRVIPKGGDELAVIRNDLALLVLAEAIPPNVAKPVPLAPFPASGTLVQIVGFGARDLRDGLVPIGAGIKRQAVLKAITGNEAVELGADLEREAVARDPMKRVDASPGDGGAPVYVTANPGGPQRLVAIVSHAVFNRDDPKLSGDGCILMRVDVHLGWFRREAEKQKATPPVQARPN